LILGLQSGAKQSLICVNELQQQQQQQQQHELQQQQQQSRYCLHSDNLSVCLSISPLNNYTESWISEIL